MEKTMRRDSAPEMVRWAKGEADRRMAEARSRGDRLTRGAALEEVAAGMGYRDWNRFAAAAVAAEARKLQGVAIAASGAPGPGIGDPRLDGLLCRFGWDAAFRVRPYDRLQDLALGKHTLVLAPRRRMRRAADAALRWVGLSSVIELPGREDALGHKHEIGLRSADHLGRESLPAERLAVVIGSAERAWDVPDLDVLMAQARAWGEHLIVCMDPSEATGAGKDLAEIVSANASSVLCEDEGGFVAISMPCDPWSAPWVRAALRRRSCDLSDAQARAIARFRDSSHRPVIAVWSSELSQENLRLAMAVREAIGQGVVGSGAPDYQVVDASAPGWFGSPAPGDAGTSASAQIVRVAASSHEEALGVTLSRCGTGPERVLLVRAAGGTMRAWPRDVNGFCELARPDGGGVRIVGERLSERLRAFERESA